MRKEFRIRPAKHDDLEALCALRRASILATTRTTFTKAELHAWAALDTVGALRGRIDDRCTLIAESTDNLQASIGLQLDSREILALFVLPTAQGHGLGRTMVTAIEKLAVQFGLLELKLSTAETVIDFYRTCGYQICKNASLQPHPRTGLMAMEMRRHFPHRQTRFGRIIAALHQQLGISPDYGYRFRLKLQPECAHPVSIGEDVFSRTQNLSPQAARAWHAMRNAAATDGVELQVVSGLRSVDYQTGIIRAKLDKGQNLSQILKVSAAPGYSEHHSGRALDVNTPGFEPLEEEFENSQAFRWLMDSAGKFGFGLSYPKNNRHGIAYEPWHWCLL